MAKENDDEHLQDLRRALPVAQLTVGELWLKYFALGGSADQLELEAYLYGVHAFPALERGLVVQAVNERLAEMLLDLRIPYSATPEPREAE